MGIVERSAEVVWTGELDSAGGCITTDSGLLDGANVSAEGRFSEGPRRGATAETSPEELIAAALGSCYSMSLSHHLTGAGFRPERLRVTATCHLDTQPGQIAVKDVELSAVGALSGMAEDRFSEIAETAFANCPVAKLLAGNARFELHAQLEEPALSS